MEWIDDELARLREQGLHRTRRRLESGQGTEVRWQGYDFVNFGSNDYLGFAADPRLSRAAARAAARYGSGAGASPLVSGYSPPVQRLERDLAAWEDVDAAVVFASGYAANLSVVGTLGRGGAIFSDELNHASVIDGCRLARASVHVYRHNDVTHLEELLRAHPGPRRVIVSDTVFSMDGDLADVPRLAALADEHDTLLVLDEAHATGVLGVHGRGLTDALAEPSERIVKVGTLSKAFASQGGFACGDGRVIEYLVNAARPYVFSTALAPAAAAAARRALFLAGQEPHRREHVLALAEGLRTKLRVAGHDVGRSACHIVPVIVGDAAEAMALAAQLEERRLLVPAIRPPSVPTGTSRLRIGLSAGHTEQDVARLVAGLTA